MTINYATEWYLNMKPNYREFDEGIPEFWSMKYSDRVYQFWDLLGKEPFTPLKLLDIGCGMGRACAYYKTYGLDVTGVEPSVYASGIAKERGINVLATDFASAELLPETYDVVHIEQVLSHVSDFQAVLDKANKLLKPGGLICVEEPNDGNPLQRILEAEHGNYWVTNDHVNYFNHTSLSAGLVQSGFKVVTTSSTWPMELFELQGDHYLGDGVKGKEVHRKRYELESALPYSLRQGLHEMFAKLGIGRDAEIIGKKGV